MIDRTIRPVRPDDIPVITEIYRDAVLHGTSTFELDPPDEQEMLRRVEVLVEGGYPYLVAEHGGAVIGSGCAGPYRSRPGYRYTIEDSIYLASESRGKGVGKRLLAALISQAEEGDFRQMVAIITDTVNNTSVRLHRAAGFGVVGVIHNVGYKFGRWLDTVVMERALGAGSNTPPKDDSDR